jgi:hypothetical protein
MVCPTVLFWIFYRIRRDFFGFLQEMDYSGTMDIILLHLKPMLKIIRPFPIIGLAAYLKIAKEFFMLEPGTRV